MAWTAEQVLGLAPDEPSAKAGRGQSSPTRWSSTGQAERALWGLCQGSGSKPYQTAVDLSEPAFKCSCPSRKFPCKHGLGLMLLWAQNPAALPTSVPPDWASDWLASRDQRATKAAEKTASAAEVDPGKAAASAAKRVEQREKRVAAGLDELQLWLEDLARQGLAQAEQRSHAYWEQMAARLVDAQATGLARRVRDMRAGLGIGERWPDELLQRAGQLQLLIDAYRDQDRLTPALRAEVRSQVGWTVAQEDLLAGPPVSDTWKVCGALHVEEDRLRVRRTWLYGTTTRQWALLLDFAAPGQHFPVAPAPSQAVRADIAYYPGARPLRAVLVAQHDARELTDGLPAGSVEDAYRARAQALAANPWTDRVPVAIVGTPVRRGEAWWLADSDGCALALGRDFPQDALTLLAIGGGETVPVFGEWDISGGLTVLSADAGDELWLL